MRSSRRGAAARGSRPSAPCTRSARPCDSTTSGSNTARLYALILSGGAGKRLWPRSRRRRPKQFLDLVDGRTLLQDTVARVSDLIPEERILIVAPPEHRVLIREQLPELRFDHLVTEPYPRGTAAAVGLAIASLSAFDPEGIVAVLPSDHVVRRRDRFRAVLIAAAAAADAGRIVTLGITPDRADTGYGYIEAGERLELDAPVEVRTVRRFIEKPSRGDAERMIAAGGHYWNAGMFVWRVDTVLRAYREHLPRTAHAIEALSAAHGSERYESVLAEVWEETERTTLDYGIAEKAKNVAVVPADIGWFDVGTWSRLAEIGGAPLPDLIEVDSTGSLVHAPDKLVALVGVHDLIVIDAGDALLVASRERSEDVKKVVEELEREGREDLL